MGGLGASFLVRRARASWLLLACIAVIVLLTTGLAAAGWTFSATVVPGGALSALADPQARVMSLSGVVDTSEAAADSRLIRAKLRTAWPGVGFQMESALWSDPIQLPSGAGVLTTQIQAASLPGITARAMLTAGKWPGPPHHGGPVPVALPAAVASRLHVTLGSVLTGASQPSQARVSLQVTGLFRPRNPASLYWKLDRLPTSGISVQHYSVSTAGQSEPVISVSYGPAVVNPAAFGGPLAAGQGSWLVLPQARPMARGNIEALAEGTSDAVSQLAVVLPEGLQVTSGLPPLLDGIASTIVLARSLFTIAALELLLVAGAGLVLAARLLASLREDESALLWARGATRRQLVRPVLAEAVVLGGVAGLVGVLAGTYLAGALAGLANLRLDGYQGRGISPLAWLWALVVLVLCAAVMAWPALHTLTPGAARLRRSRQARLAGIAWAGGDLALVALAAVSIWQLRGYSAVAHTGTGPLGIDPVVAIAPALALAGLALIPLRGLPLLARLADKATDHERRLAAAMVSWQIARRPIRQAGPALLVVLATATTTLALAGYASWRQSAADQAAFAVGSDVRVDSAGGVPPGAAEKITGAPGVTASTAASLIGLGHGNELIALDTSTAGKTILLRPDLSPLPLSAAWRRITPQLPGLALPGQADDRLEVLAALEVVPHSSAEAAQMDLGAVTVTAWVQDSTGTTYPIPAAGSQAAGSQASGSQASGSLPADGRPHALVFVLPGPRAASYPLRLVGLTLNYSLPPYDPARPTSAPTASLTIESLAVAKTARGPFGRPLRHGDALAAWDYSGSAVHVPTGPPGQFQAIPASDGSPPTIKQWSGAPGGAQRLEFSTGHDPSLAVMASAGLSPGSPATAALTAVSYTQAVPAMATTGYLAANRLRIGSTTSVSLNLAGQSFAITVRIVASVARFPTVFGPDRALIVNLADINDQLIASQSPTLSVTRWWLRTAGGRRPHLPAGLGLSVTDRASQEAALLNNPLLKGPRQAMLAIGLAAVLLGAGGFSVSVAGSLRSRRTQSAVFAALGVGKNAQAGQLCLEQCVLSIPAAAAGLLAGIGLAQLLVPAITLTTDAAAPIPSALVIMPLGPAVALALVTAAVPGAAAALSVLRRPDPAAQLRAEAG
jgi:ABC-type antimicrobial peptide transport system permease subunit